MSETLKPRQSAVRILARVLTKDKTVPAAIALERDFETFTESDQQFVRLLVLTTLRRMGEIDLVIGKLLQKPLSKKHQTVQLILRLGVAQALFLNTPAYAVVNTSVGLVKRFHLEGLAPLVNAILRNLYRQQKKWDLKGHPTMNLPQWLEKSWVKAYGAENTQQMAHAILNPPPLDISVPDHPEEWAQKWNGSLLPTGGVRVMVSDPRDLPDFEKSGGWVQNAAASVPAQLFTDISGKRVADLCAAPGGKTAQLACRGAYVSAFDISEKRIRQLRENMKRLNLQVSVCVGDICDLSEKDIFDAVLLDAPCSATGTLARHPEIKYQKTEADIIRLADMQKKLLQKAIQLVKHGGEIVFSTCSLQPEEGDSVIQSVLNQVDIIPPKDSKWEQFLTPFGSLRILPLNGFDGFYACLMRKK